MSVNAARTSACRYRSQARLVGGFGFAAQVLGENDGLGQFLHGAAEPAALVPKAQVSLFLREAVTLLQDALGALYQFASLELTPHLESLLHETGVGLRQARLGDGAAHLLA